MKVIAYSLNSDKNNPAVFLMADSSILKDGKPFFVPNFPSPITMAPAAVVHINRLGKNIARRFASRYYDSIALGLSLTVNNGAKGALWATQQAFDGAAIMGEFVDTQSALDSLFTLKIGDVEVASGRLPSADVIDGIIEYISQYMTLKIGDYIYCVLDTIPQEMVPELHFTGSIGDKTLLSFKSK